MIKFTELYIDKELQHLHIKVEVPNDKYHENIYIKNIAIDTLDTYSHIGPSDRTVYLFKTLGDEYLKTLEIECNVADLIADLKDNLFIVYVSSKGEYPFDVPCGIDNVTSIGVAYNECFIKDLYMALLKPVGDECSIPKDFIKGFIEIEAFKTALETGHISTAVEYFKRFFRHDECGISVPNKPFIVKHCNCGK